MIRAEGLHLVGDSFALSASFELEAGSLTALIGPSGAGKSSLLDTMAGFLRPQSGALWLNGRDHTVTAPSDRPVSLLFQDDNLFPHLTVAENIGLGVRSDLRLSSGDHRRVTEIQERLGLAGLGERLLRALSGGQVSRAALARALLRDRSILLLDEPFAALGPAMRVDLASLLRDIQRERGLTTVIVTHQPEDAVRVAEQVMVVAKGAVDGPIPVERLTDDPPDALADYLGGWRAS